VITRGEKKFDPYNCHPNLVGQTKSLREHFLRTSRLTRLCHFFMRLCYTKYAGASDTPFAW
jgi:hypothetical protein